jgi:hypothetical protein
MNSKLGIAGTIVAAIALLIGAVFAGLFSSNSVNTSVTTFEECIEIPGGRIMETWPVQCQYKGVIYSSPSPYSTP